MSLAHVIADVFTDTPLRGNQLAVFEDGSALSNDQMQRLAREMNLSETVFRFRTRRVHHKGPATGEPVLHDFLPSGRAAHRSDLDYLRAERCNGT
jgi:hypothetical protein